MRYLQRMIFYYASAQSERMLDRSKGDGVNFDLQKIGKGAQWTNRHECQLSNIKTVIKPVIVLLSLACVAMASLPASSSPIRCVISDEFSKIMPLYNKIDGVVIKNIDINPKTRVDKYKLSLMKSVVIKNSVFWSAVIRKETGATIGFLKHRGAPIKCYGRGF